MMDKTKLCALAISAMQSAYAPYSGYKVGAVLLTKEGKVYTGCNIENASLGATNCAERTAFFKALSEGERDFAMMAIAGGKDGKVAGAFPPCGICRQVMREFCGDDFIVLLVTGEDGYEEYKLADLLPHCFAPQHLEE